MQNHWPVGAAEIIARLIADSPPHPSPYVREEAARLDALFVGYGLWATTYLRPNGEVVVTNVDPFAGGEEVTTDRVRVIEALVILAERYPEVRALIPNREPGSIDCDWCASFEPARSGKMICSKCGGLGWLPAQPPDHVSPAGTT